jgi:hypothetical protein
VVGVQLAERADLAPLLERIDTSGLDVRLLPPDSPVFRLLV